ncbi:MAG TPA: hypothetical protein VG713_09200 [Pirellulales bacterium]|nr:hypothetical protein [Pirellulales bacterium]
MPTRLLVVLCVLLVGCGRDEQIQQYTAAKPHVLDKLTGGDGSLKLDKPSVEKGKPGRTLGAIALHGGQGWFFKLTGPDDAVAEQRDPFMALLRSVRFPADAKGPTWTTPDDWKQLPASGMRYATLKIEGPAAPLELTVIALPHGDDLEDNDYLLSNVNRWRDQLKLPPIKIGDLETQTEQIKLADDSDATFVDLVGTLSEGPPMGVAPFARGGGGMLPEGHPPVGAPKKPESPK